MKLRTQIDLGLTGWPGRVNHSFIAVVDYFIEKERKMEHRIDQGMASDSPKKGGLLPSRIAVQALTRVASTVTRRKLHISDSSRWRQDASLAPAWEDRVALMASKIEPGRRVLDIGSGAQTTRRHLPDNCEYIPLDLVARTPETIVCDLNRDTLPALQVDWVIASGVLEYIIDIPRFLAEVASASRHAVVSYAVRNPGDSVFGRRTHGWVNDFTQEQIEALLIRYGFVVDECNQWKSQMIYWLTANID